MEKTALLRQKKMASAVIFQVMAIAVGLLVLFPIIYCFFVSFMKPTQIQTIPPTFFPKEWTLENYVNVLETTTIGRFMLNSRILAGVSSVIRLITASFAAFAFSFYQFKGRNVLFMLCLGTVMIPSDVVLVTNYQTISRLGLVNSYIGMMSVFCVAAMNIFMMRQNFLTFSKTLQEAAYVDGCSNLRFFFRILLPTSTPVLTSVFISSFISTWNTYVRYRLKALELNEETANKASALTCLASMLQIPMEEVLVIGDDDNDIQMFQAAGYSAAVGNASENAMRFAGYCCQEKEFAGVKEAIAKYCGGI